MKTNILDYIDFEDVNKLLEGFNKSTGFVTAILDLEGNVLSKSGWRQICTEFHRINPETAKNCTISDTILADKLGKDEKYHFYKCLNGLVDVAVPVVVNGEHIANLFSGQFFFEEPDRMFFKEQAGKYEFYEEKYLEALAKVPVVSKEKVLIAMDFLLNMTQLISKMTFQKLEQTELNITLKESEEKFKSVFESANAGKSITLLTGEINVNRAFCNMLGYTREELQNKKWQDLTPEDEIPGIQKNLDTILKGKKDSVRFEKRYICKNGNHIWADVNVSSRRDENNKPLYFITTVIDITERKKAEKAQLESEEKYRLISDNSDDWIYWLMPDGHIYYVSPACKRITGYSPEEFTEHPELNQQIVFDADKEIVNQHSKSLKLDSSPHNLEYRIVTKGGDLRWISHSCSPILSDKGEYLGRVGTNRNITERKLREEQLYESEFRFNKLYENGPFGMVLTDKEYRFKKANPAFCSITGYDEAEIRKLTFKDITHPDDLNKDLINVQKLIHKELTVYKTYKRYIRKDRKVIWGSLTVTATYDSEGQFLYNLGIIEDITEQKMAAEKIREKDQEFRKLSANVPDLIYQFTRRPDGTYFVPIASEGIRNIFGCSPEDVLDDFTPIGRVIYPDDVVRVLNDIEYSAEHLNHFTCEFRVQIPGREIQWIYSNSTPERLPDGSVTWYGFNVDITTKKLADEALKEKSSRLELAMQTANMAWWEMNIRTGNVTFDNRKATMLGYPSEKFKHYSDFTALVHPEDFDKAMNAMKNHLSGLSDNYEVEYRIMTSSGEYKWYYDIGAIVKKDSNGVPLNVIGFVLDITDRKKVDENIRLLNEELEQRVSERTSELEASNKELEAFSYSVSHDLRAPLRHVIGFSEKLESVLKDRTDPEITRLTGKIKSSASKMSRLIDELLTYSRLGRTDLRTIKLSVNTIIDDIIKEAEDITKDRKIEWIIKRFPRVYADPTLLKLVLQNLILNSIKFTEKKRNAIIEIDFAEKTKKEYTFYIKDNGAGFNMEYANKLFGVFQRLHSTEEFEGTGIGLAIVRRIINKHNGSVWAEGIENEGASFFFTLPK